MLLKYSAIRQVKSPARGHATDAGIDFFVPEFTKDFLEDLLEKSPKLKNIDPNDPPEMIGISSGESILIPAGVKLEIPYGYMGLFLNKSGVASKRQLLIGAQVIDTFYSGEVHINLHNVGNNPVFLEPGDKIVQMTLVPVLNCDLTEVEEDHLYDYMLSDKNRGSGGFGSTGTK